MTIITAIGENLALGKDKRSLRGRKPRRSGFRKYLISPDVTSIDDLAYIIDDTKATVPEVKQAFKEFFTAKADEMFNAIWENQSLRDSLLDNPTDEIQAFQRFNNLISELDNTEITNPKLYSFIKSE